MYSFIKISTPEDLININNIENTQNLTFVQTNDIDMKGYDFKPIVNFKGVYQGNHHTISNLSIKSVGYTGLFSYTNNAELFNINIDNSNITGKYIAGTLVGMNKGDIFNCSSTNHSISGEHHIGGLVGENRGKIIDSNTIGKTTGFGFIGGFVGNNSKGYIYNSSSNSVVKGEDNTGSFAGVNSDIIDSCQAIGILHFDNITNYFTGWNKDEGLIVKSNCNVHAYNKDIYIGLLNNPNFEM